MAPKELHQESTAPNLMHTGTRSNKMDQTGSLNTLSRAGAEREDEYYKVQKTGPVEEKDVLTGTTSQ